MNCFKIYKKLKKIDADVYRESVRKAEREDLERETLALRNAVLELGNSIQYEDALQSENDELYEKIQTLEDDNERLRKAVTGMYDTFKKYSLKFIVESDLSTDDLNLFKQIFKSYLK